MQRSQPIGMGLRRLRIGHPHVDVLRHHNTTDDRLDRRNPHKAAIRLRPLKSKHLQLLSFKDQAVALEHVRHDGFGRHIGAHFRPPESQFAFDGLLDVINGWLRGEDLGLGERGRQGVEAEVVVRVAVTDVDGGQLLAAGADFFHHLLGLGFAELGIHQNRFLFAADQHRGHREDGFFARVVDIQRQGRGGCMGGEAEGGTGQ
ncbi:hypothetical protein D3C75_797770 [compost metagenome]